MENDRHKFRVWDNILNQYITEIADVAIKNNGELINYKGDTIRDCVIEQCTGISASKSYRGNKPEDLLIWEGDKTRYSDRQSDYVYGYITWRGAGFVLMNLDGSLNGLIWTPNHLQIIGNVHEVKA
jgi:hypothetical protein